MSRLGLRHELLVVLVLASTMLASRGADAQDAPQPPASVAADAQTSAKPTSPWLLVPLVSSNPKLGTAFGALGAYIHQFDDDSRQSLFGLVYQYTSTHSTITAAFARTSFGADHHRVVAVAAFGHINNDYQDYLGSGQPLQTNDNIKAVAGRYLYRVRGDWFLGAQGTSANYQVFGADPEDDLVLETLGLRGFSSSAIGAVIMRDSRDNEDMPARGWYLNLNNFAYREALGGAESFDAYRVDDKFFWQHGGRHVLAIRQYNWLTHEAPSAAQAAVVLRGYKFGQYLAPYMSSLETEERLLFTRRIGATVFAGIAGLYGDRGPASSSRQFYPTYGAGLQFVIKPDKHMLANFEYAQGIEDNHGFYLKFGYAW